VAPPDILYVLGIDPGTLTGLSVVRFTLRGEVAHVWHGELEWDVACDAIEYWTYQIRRRPGHALVGGEKFTVNSKTHLMGQPGIENTLGILGVARRTAKKRDVEMRLVGPNPAKKLCDNEGLRMIGCHVRGGEGHANDATRQCVFHALKEKALDPRRVFSEAT